MSHSPTISALVIARNEAAMIANCLDCLHWCDEVIVVDNKSEDETAEIARAAGARVSVMNGGFAELRNAAVQKSKTDWVLYIDADERVSPDLAAEISAVIASEASPTAYAISRRNIMYGHELQHGGWQYDAVVRLFRREALKEWAGDIHEHAVVQGQQGRLQQQLWHLTHRSVIESLQKTIEWTPIEAQLLFDAGQPPVTAKTLVRKGVMEAWRRLFRRGGRRDGVVGWVEALTQSINRMLVYMQVWELQQRPSVPQRYQELEAYIAKQWRQSTSTRKGA